MCGSAHSSKLWPRATKRVARLVGRQFLLGGVDYGESFRAAGVDLLMQLVGEGGAVLGVQAIAVVRLPILTVAGNLGRDLADIVGQRLPTTRYCRSIRLARSSASCR